MVVARIGKLIRNAHPKREVPLSKNRGLPITGSVHCETQIDDSHVYDVRIEHRTASERLWKCGIWDY